MTAVSTAALRLSLAMACWILTRRSSNLLFWDSATKTLFRAPWVLSV